MATNIPRWMTQGTPSIGDASANRLRVVTPDDLQAASQMYGQLSQSMFEVARTNVYGLTYHRPDITAMDSYEKYQTASNALNKLRGDPRASSGGKDYSKLADPIINDATKEMGFLEGRVMKRFLMNEKFSHATNIDHGLINQEIAASTKFKQDEWDKKNIKYLSTVDSSWSPEEHSQFKDSVKKDRRESIKFISEGQHELLDNEFEKDYKAATVINDVLKDNKFIKPKEINTWLASGKLEQLFSDPDLKERAMRIMDNGLQIHNAAATFSDRILEYAVDSAFLNFRSKFDNEPNEVKKRELWKQEMKVSNEYDAKYRLKLKQLGAASGFVGRGFGYGGAKGNNDEWRRKGINNEMDHTDVAALFQNGKIDGAKYSAYKTGMGMRKKEYEGQDKDFESKIKAEFSISIRPPKGKHAQFADQFMPKSPSDIALKSYILERKASLMEQGLKADEYQKGLNEIMLSAKQKKMEINQQKQAVYGSQLPRNVLTNVYGTK